MKRTATTSKTSTTGTTISAVLGVIALALIFFVPAPRPAGAKSPNPNVARTGAPPSEGTCYDCHGDFTENDGGGSITLTGLPAAYTPGATYTLGMTVARTGMSRWGFEATALTSANVAAGTLTDTNVYVGKQTSGGKQYIGQTTSKGSDGTFVGQANTASWAFDWTAPAAGAGTITFYFSGVAADNASGNSGDYVYTSSQSSTEGSSTAVEATTWGDIKTIYR